MEWIWVVLITALLSFCFWFTYKLGYRRGYKEGARVVLKWWQKTLDEGEMKNDEQ